MPSECGQCLGHALCSRHPKLISDLHLVCQSLQAALTSHFSLASNRFIEVRDGKDPLGHSVRFPPFIPSVP